MSIICCKHFGGRNTETAVRQKKGRVFFLLSFFYKKNGTQQGLQQCSMCGEEALPKWYT